MDAHTEVVFGVSLMSDLHIAYDILCLGVLVVCVVTFIWSQLHTSDEE